MKWIALTEYGMATPKPLFVEFNSLRTVKRDDIEGYTELWWTSGQTLKVVEPPDYIFTKGLNGATVEPNTYAPLATPGAPATP
jgi:hypothetical protein